MSVLQAACLPVLSLEIVNSLAQKPVASRK
jgi:hypothetical protein